MEMNYVFKIMANNGCGITHWVKDGPAVAYEVYCKLINDPQYSVIELWRDEQGDRFLEEHFSRNNFH